MSSSFFKQFWQSYSLNNLASVWYSVLTTSFQIYIIVRSIYRFSAYISLPWLNGNAPQDSINFYMFSIATGILIVPFFIIVSLMKVGNYPNDGRKLGLFDLKKCLASLDSENDDRGNGSKKFAWWKITWKHSLPIGPMLHLLMAFFFLLPRLMTESQLIRHGFLNKSVIWKTDLDFLIRRFNGKIFNFFGSIQTINTTEHDYIFSDSSTLGQYFIRNSKLISDAFYELDESGRFSLEFFNLIIALMVLTIRYPAVFWHVNKPLSMILTFQLMLSSCQSIIAFNAFEIAFKIFICDPTHMLIRFRDSSSMTLGQLLLLIFIYLITLQFSSVSVYVYGLQKYREFRYARTKYFQNKYENIAIVNLLPYSLAILFFLIPAFIMGPLFNEFVIIYCGSLSISALMILISTIVYFICWILLWIFLATKTIWNFQYEDIESNNDSLLNDMKSKKHCSILVSNYGKIFHIKDELATMAIINFIQSNGFEKNQINQKFNEQIKTNTNQIENQKNCHGTLSKNFRFTAKKIGQKTQNKDYFMERKINSDYPSEESDEGEYTTFYRMKRSYSLNQKRTHGYARYSPVKLNPNPEYELTYQNQTNSSLKMKPNINMSNNVAYGLMCNHSKTNSLSVSKTSDIPDGISNVSSGFHSNGSNSSLSSSSNHKQSLDRCGSLESLMQKIEEAAADRPKIRSLSPLQNHCLKSKQESSMGSNNLAFKTFPSKQDDISSSSRLIEFTENPDYSKYYLPHVVISN